MFSHAHIAKLFRMRMRNHLYDDVGSLCLVKECSDLEIFYGTSYTDAILEEASEGCFQDVKRTIRRIDKDKCLLKCCEKAPTIAEVTRRGGSWPKLWDASLHLGTRHSVGLQKLSRLMAHHGRGSHPCPLCDKQDPMSVIEHALSEHHQDLGLNWNSMDYLLTQMVEGNIQFVYIQVLV